MVACEFQVAPLLLVRRMTPGYLGNGSQESVTMVGVNPTATAVWGFANETPQRVCDPEEKNPQLTPPSLVQRIVPRAPTTAPVFVPEKAMACKLAVELLT